MILADNNANFDNANYRYTLSLINMLLIREWFVVLKYSQYSRERERECSSIGPKVARDMNIRPATTTNSYLMQIWWFYSPRSLA